MPNLGTFNWGTANWGESVAPTLIANTGATVARDGTVVLTQAMLEYQDDVSEDVIYTVTSEPTGTLRNGITALGENDTFNQSDINAGDITYEETNGTITADSFGFTVEDEAGNVVEDLTFAITVPTGGGRPIGGNTITHGTVLGGTAVRLG